MTYDSEGARLLRAVTDDIVARDPSARVPMEPAYVFPTGDDASPSLTQAQRNSLARMVSRWELTLPVTVHPVFAGDGAVMVDVGRMWLGVEPDGYTHS